MANNHKLSKINAPSKCVLYCKHGYCFNHVGWKCNLPLIHASTLMLMANVTALSFLSEESFYGNSLFRSFSAVLTSTSGKKPLQISNPLLLPKPYCTRCVYTVQLNSTQSKFFSPTLPSRSSFPELSILVVRVGQVYCYSVQYDN